MSRTPWRTVQRQWALHQGGNNTWYRIKNQIGGPTQLHIYDEIGYFGVSAKDLIRDLADVNGPIELHLNSPGGEVHEGIAIYNTLMSRNDVAVHIDGIAASIASVIAMAGNPILIARTAQMMVHDGYAMAIGDAQDFRDQAEVLDKASNLIAGVYADHTGKPLGYWREIMKAETWYDSQEAIDAGLADRFVPSSQVRQTTDHRMDDRWDINGAFKHTPASDAATVPYVGEHQTRHLPMTGTHTHDHAAHGDGDADDGIHGGDGPHTHANDANHDHPEQHPHGQMRAGRVGQTGNRAGVVNSVDNSSWDASRAMSAAATADNPASAYKAICAGRRAGDADEQGSWALPHHYKPGGPPNAHGVQAALGRIGQTKGLTNEDAARSHLEAHMREINPDWQPDNSSDNPFGLTQEDIEHFTKSVRL
jgi:ATP-dependent protease ClpP protease subunit